jgi:hypothetical protein
LLVLWLAWRRRRTATAALPAPSSIPPTSHDDLPPRPAGNRGRRSRFTLPKPRVAIVLALVMAAAGILVYSEGSRSFPNSDFRGYIHVDVGGPVERLDIRVDLDGDYIYLALRPTFSAPPTEPCVGFEVLLGQDGLS